jgi:transcriptional regulator of acetoin/glycerol metabolism
MAPQAPRTRGPDEIHARRWRLLVVDRGAVEQWVLDSPAAVAVKSDGRSALLDLSSPDSTGARFVARDDGILELSASSDTPVLLNDVQLARAVALRAGDFVQVGAASVLVQRETPLDAATHSEITSWPRETFEARLAEEVRRAIRANRRMGLLFIRGAPAPRAGDDVANASAFGERFSALLDLEGDGIRFESALSQSGRAAVPEDALTTDELVECALARLSKEPVPPRAPEERVVLDPVMVRLRGVMEQLAMSESHALIEGEPGTGKRLWAWHMHLRSGHRSETWREIDGRRLTAAELSAAFDSSAGERLSGTLLLRHVDQLAPAAQQALLEHWPPRLRVLATAAPRTDLAYGGLAPAMEERLGRITLTLPALRDRPSEILPLALQALQQARARLGRAGLALNAEARAALQAWPWPGNVRELRNQIALAAHVAESDEIRLENLSPRIAQRFHAARAAVSKKDLREALKLAEKNALLGVLARTSWNVTAAAKELGLPRRTVVYRIARLGLKRPRR